MTPSLSKNTFLVKEHIGMFKAANNFDIYDPETGTIVAQCREPKLGFFTRMLRFDKTYKKMTPFNIEVRTPGGELYIRVQRGVSFFRSQVKVYDGEEREIGGFRQKLFTIGGSFDVLNKEGRAVCTLKGKWTGWDFRFMYGKEELAHVTKKWTGLGKEMFTSADNYMLNIAEGVTPENPIRKLIFAAVLCIDMVLKE
ncbi:MAG: RNAase [Fibrobacteria bacterium]|nr:RNAase [Fibrobacteria bacterium]